MTSNDIVCRCNLVTVGDIRDLRREYPNIPDTVIKQSLNVGTRCGCCKFKECPNIDIHIDKVLENL